jgi:N-acetyltransferase 10
MLQNKVYTAEASDITPGELHFYLTPYDLKRLELYTKNMADYHLIMDLVPAISKIYFLNKLVVHIFLLFSLHSF